MIIKKIFEDVYDDGVHGDLIKFGKGEYNNRYVISARKNSSGYLIKTGPEYASFFVKSCLKKLTEDTGIKGVIVSTSDLSRNIKFPTEKTKNFMGIKRVAVNSVVNPRDILDLMDKYPRAFFALSFSGNDFKLKIKPKSPKSPKPSVKTEEEPNGNFCSLKTSDAELIKELFFDCPDFSNIEIKHTIKIADIIYPKNAKNLKPEEIREQSKRKGILVREIEQDGQKRVVEHEFEA